MITMSSQSEKHGIAPMLCFEDRAETRPFIQLCNEQQLPYLPCSIANELWQLEPTTPSLLAGKVARVIIAFCKTRPDVVHLTLPNPIFGLGIMIAAALLQIPAVVVFQWVGEMTPLPERKQAVYRWCRRHRQQWVAVSRRDAQGIHESFGIAVDHVIQNAALSNRIREKTSYGINGKKEITFVTVGRIGSAKGHDLIVQAIPHIIKKHPQARFVWVGGGKTTELDLLIKKYKVSDFIIETGLQSNVADWLVDADFFLLPSRSEGQSFALSEAMAAGIPILCSDAGGSPEVIRDKENGVLFYANDACSLQDAVLWGLENYEQMIDMGKQAKVDYRKYTGEMMVRDTFQIMHEMLKSENIPITRMMCGYNSKM